MKIDFHCHTKATKKGESALRNVDIDKFNEYITNAQVKMVAITNHNEFDIEQYVQLKTKSCNDFLVFPGIELDIKGINEERGHIICVYDDLEYEIFSKKIDELLENRNPDDVLIPYDKFIEFINNINCIVLAHYHKKEELHLDTLKFIKSQMKNNYRFFYEPSNYRTLGIMVNNDFRVLKGTDKDTWENYSEQDFANVKLEIDSYKNFMKFIEKDEKVIESLLHKQKKYNIDISYNKKNKECVTFYDNTNILFGTKGTGKSVSLEKIYDYFKKNGKNISYYTQSQVSKKITEKLKVADSEKSLKKYGLDTLEEELKYIAEWKTNSITQFDEYYNYVKYKGDSKNIKKMKILEISNKIIFDNTKLIYYKNEYNNYKLLIANLSAIGLEQYLDATEKKHLSEIISKLHGGISDNLSNEIIEKYSVDFTNKSFSSIKNIVEKNTECKTVPAGTNLKDFAKNLYKLDISVKKILNSLKFSKTEDEEYVGELEEGKLLYKKLNISMVSDKSRADDGYNKIVTLKKICKELVAIQNNLYNLNLDININEFNNLYSEFDKLSLNNFTSFQRKFFLNGNEYRPSSGEETMILLDEMLREDYDVYILDEPEKSLGNNYVNDILVKKINDLAKLKKTIIIATHNANIAVRTFPYCTVLKSYNNNIYETYVGSLYTNKLKNINDNKLVKNWKDESVSILEGGRLAFSERGDVYE